MRRISTYVGRRWALATTRPRPLVFEARRRTREVRGVLVLQAGSNPSVDYFLRPRLEAAGTAVPWAVANLEDAPAKTPLWSREGLLVVFCRYTNRRWLDAIEAERDRLAGVAYFVDDDLKAMSADRSLRRTTRGKVADNYLVHLDRLEALMGERWVSAPGLADRLAPPDSVVLTPLPCDPPAPPRRDVPPLVVYHASDTHQAERRFIVEVARACARVRPDIRFEITGSPALAGRDRPANIDFVDQLSWPDYRRRQQGRQAALFLGPLEDRSINAVRAPVKVFDAARMGAAGVFADTAPFRGFIRDGVDGRLVPMNADAWLTAITDMIDDPDRRLALVQAAHDRILAMDASASPLPLGAE